MWIDAETLKNDGVTPELLSNLIRRYKSKNKLRYKKLNEYYIGNHKILSRTKQNEALANNKMVCNNAKYIVDMSTSFFIGVPVEYSASAGYDIEDIKNAYFEQEISSLDIRLAKKAGICGRAYELIFADLKSKPRSVMIEPSSGFIVYDDTAEHNKLFGVYFYHHYDSRGTVSGSEVLVVDSENAFTFKTQGKGYVDLHLENAEPHYFGGVPMIEYRNNDEAQGDFEQLISLIDAYNLLMSDRVNDKEQFVDAILFLVNVTLNTETARKLKTERILEAVPGYGETAKAEYLSKSLAEADVEILRKALKEDIQQYSMIPNLSDENFAGNLSGVAIQYKLLGFQQHVKNKEPLFTKALRERFELYNHFLSVKGGTAIVPAHRVEIQYSRNLPSNSLEISQMINNLKGTVSDETLIGQVPFVQDAREEYELMQKQKELEAHQRVSEQQRYLSGSGYNVTAADIGIDDE